MNEELLSPGWTLAAKIMYFFVLFTGTLSLLSAGHSVGSISNGAPDGNAFNFRTYDVTVKIGTS
jgi:hypothetical protein